MFLVAFAFANMPNIAQAIPIRLSYLSNYAPPNPCVDDVLTGFIGIFELTPDGYSSLIGDGIRVSPSPCDGSSIGAFIFDITEDADIFLSYNGSIQYPEPGPPDVPVYAFDEGTAEGDGIVSTEPGSAPFINIGMVIGDGSIQYTNPSPPNLPLFAFSSPGVEIGSLGVEMETVPEPATIAFLGIGLLGLVGVALRRRLKRVTH